jgi:hypothetical protein
MAKLNLYLDDVRTPVEPDWIVVRDYDAFVSTIMYHGLDAFETISLDHDLGDEAMTEYYNNVQNNYKLDYENIREKTGYDAAKYLVNESIDKGIPLPQVYVHSANPIGSANIMGYINNYLMNCRLKQSCVRVQIPHTIIEHLQMSPEARQAKWGNRKQ